MKPLFIAFILLATLVCPLQATSPSISKEARECFEWFGTLGFPDLRDAIWAEIQRANSDGEVITPSRLTFVLQQEEHSLTLLDAHLCPAKRSRGELATLPRQDELNFVARPFEPFCQTYLTTPPEARPRVRFWTELTPKAETFYLAYACWSRGDDVMAKNLFNASILLPDPYAHQPNAAKSMQEYLNREFATLTIWQAYLLAGGIDEFTAAGTNLASRQVVLAAFERLSRFSSSPHLPRATHLANTLKSMLKEDATHHNLDDRVLATLSAEDQTREYIFRLRDQNGYQIVQPGTCDIFIGKNWTSLEPNDSPAHRLAKLGLPAVPLLIEALSDTRLTRSVNFSRSSLFSHRMLTVGDCAAIILSKIANQNFRFHHPDHLEALPQGEYDRVHDAVQEWWKEKQAEKK